MKKQVIGFIGGGHMATAMIGGILQEGSYDKHQVMASCKTKATKDRLEQDFGITVIQDNREVARKADLLVLAVKPYLFQEVIEQIRDDVPKETVVISIAAGQTLAMLKNAFQKQQGIVRAMPNTPALVGQAMSALCCNDFVSKQDLARVAAVFRTFGKVEIVPEERMNAVIGVSGSSPAYVYMMIEAMADAAVADGLPREQAYTFAAQAVKGAASMVLETGGHPGALKDAVCSPGGTTIEAVAKLEELGFAGTVIEAQRACVKKAKEMAKED